MKNPYSDSLNGLRLDNPVLADLISKIGEDVIIFRYLPSLWYKYPIPDNLREYWYNKKPEILQYFLKNYANLGIDFLPDQILQSEYENHLEYSTILTSLIDHVGEVSIKIPSSFSEVF